MKKLLLIYLTGFVLVIAPVGVKAQIFSQPPPPNSGTGPSMFSQTDNIQPGDPFITDTPIDGGVVFLILIGLALGVKRFRSKQSIPSAT